LNGIVYALTPRTYLALTYRFKNHSQASDLKFVVNEKDTNTNFDWAGTEAHTVTISLPEGVNTVHLEYNHRSAQDSLEIERIHMFDVFNGFASECVDCPDGEVSDQA
jgi:hypothetical protein